jgi:predicted nucleotidyltransferase
MASPQIAINQYELAAFCRQNGVKRLSVFGSVLRDDFDPHTSDVDVLVEFVTGAPKNLFKLLQMQNDLASMFEREVDLTTPGSLSRYFRDDVTATALVIYDAA